MKNEVELKLTIPPASAHKAEGLPWLRKLAKGPIARSDISSTYFDTKKLKLRRHGVTLRVCSRRGHRVANPRNRGRQQPQKAYAMGLLTGQEQAKRPTRVRSGEWHPRRRTAWSRFLSFSQLGDGRCSARQSR